MKPSSFQFTDPVLSELHYSVNKESLTNNDDDIKIEVSTRIGFTTRIGRSQSEPEASVELGVIISLCDNNNIELYMLKTAVGANFKWEDEYSEEELDVLLTINAPSLLLSYLRPIVANVTNCSQFPVCNIPFINFMDKEYDMVVEESVE